MSIICRQNRAIGFFIFKYFRETFFTEVTGTRISDHCVRNICIKASLKIAVLWILVRSKILGPKILVNSFKNIYNKCSCRSSARNLFHLQFHFLRFFLYISNTYFQQYQECLLFIVVVVIVVVFYCTVWSKNLLSLFLCFFKKSDALYLFSTSWVLFNLFFGDITYIEMKVWRHSKNRIPCTCFLQAGYSLTYFSEILHILKWKYDGIIYLTIYYSRYSKNIV